MEDSFAEQIKLVANVGTKLEMKKQYFFATFQEISMSIYNGNRFFNTVLDEHPIHLLHTWNKRDGEFYLLMFFRSITKEMYEKYQGEFE